MALDVLEHIYDDVKAYSEMIRLLKKEGYAVITVPAFNFLWGEVDKEVGMPPRIINQMAKLVLSLEKHSLTYGNLPFGSSLVAI